MANRAKDDWDGSFENLEPYRRPIIESPERVSFAREFTVKSIKARTPWLSP